MVLNITVTSEGIFDNQFDIKSTPKKIEYVVQYENYKIIMPPQV